MATMVSHISRGQGHEFLNKLESSGLSPELAQRVIDSKGNAVAAKVVHLIENGGFEPSTSQKRAREIMGRNFFGIEEAVEHFGVNPSRAETAGLSKVPFTERVLEYYRDGHILAAVFPMSILDIRGKVERELFRSHEDSWYNNESFAKDRGVIDWHLVCKTPIPETVWMPWHGKEGIQQRLSKNVEIPSAQVLTYMIIGHYLATGKRLFMYNFVRTNSFSSDGRRVSVGNSHPGVTGPGLMIKVWLDGDFHDGVGVAPARKSSSLLF